jgi:hypothetical protein
LRTAHVVKPDNCFGQRGGGGVVTGGALVVGGGVVTGFMPRTPLSPKHSAPYVE